MAKPAAKKATAKKAPAKKALANKTPAKKAPVKAAPAAPAFAPIAAAFANDPAVTSGMMMASFGLKVRGKIFAMHVKGDLVAKLPRPRVDELTAAGVGAHFDPGHGRPMKEWIAVPPGRGDWLALAREAYRFVKG